MALASLRPYAGNPRNGDIGSIKESLEVNKQYRPIVVNAKDNVVLCGNHTYAAAMELGWKEIAATFVDVDEEQAARIVLVDNRTNDLAWNDDALIAEILNDLPSLEGTGYDDEALEEILAKQDIPLDLDVVGEKRQTLAERFIVPPFSVLDARQGYWQERKRSWIALGIQSELGRGEGVTWGDTPEITEPGLNYYRNQNRGDALTWGVSPDGKNTRGKDKGKPFDHAKKASPGGSQQDAATLGKDGKTVRGDGAGRPIDNGLLGFSEQARSHYKKPDVRTFGSGGPGTMDEQRKEWRKSGQDLMKGESPKFAGGLATGLVAHRQAQKDGNESDYQGQEQSGTSIFDPVLCELAYRWFCPPKGIILDPFAGGSVRGIVAAKLGREYIGIDLSEAQVAANENQAEEIVPDAGPSWHVGDSRHILKLIGESKADFVFTCPPYFDLEIYSDDPNDLSCAGDYSEFLDTYRDIIHKSCSVLKPNRFAAVVVGDIRDKKGFYRNFVSDTIAAFEDAGVRLYNEAILVTSVGSLPIRVGRQFETGRKLGKTHQNVLVFSKGDPKKATQAVGSVEFGEPIEKAQDPASEFGEVLD